MKKLSVEEEVKRGLITAKYQYPATCTTYKNGIPTSSRVVTHNIKATEELRKLYPYLKTKIDRINLSLDAPYKRFRLGELGK